MRRMLSILLALSLAVLSGCGGTGPAPAAGNTNPAPAKASNPTIILSTTTSTQDSGLLGALVPAFEQKTGYKVNIIAVGTGQAIKQGERGDADVVLVHAPSVEKEALKTGAFVGRALVMHNDFIIAGPATDPAHLKGEKTAAAAFAKIFGAKANFVSRADGSGTEVMEKSLWKAANLNPDGQNWYIKAGTGMGNTLLMAQEKLCYVLTDRATWLAFKSKLKDLDLLVEKDAPLLNIYHVMRVNPDKFPKVNAAGAQAFADFILSPEGQKIVAEFGKDKYGSPLFFPDAGQPDNY